jgi:thioredoxin reductase (NADPH)
MPGSTRRPYDCVIIGGGPAGLSAAIYLARFNRSVIVADHGSGRSTTHETNDNYLGFPEGIRSTDLRDLGRRQAERFGAEFIECKIEDVSRTEDGFRAACDGIELHGRTLIFATGVRDYLPEFENEDVNDFFGKSLFWCITCDGHKVRHRRVMVVGRDDEAATTTLQFLNFTPELTLVTNRPPGEHKISDKKQRQLADANIPLVEGRIKKVYGDDGFMDAAELDDGRCFDVDFMFSQQGARPNTLLARPLGIDLDAVGYIKVDQEQRTNVPMVFGAGDVTREYAHQVVTAAHEGSTAACTANYELYRPEQRSG